MDVEDADTDSFYDEHTGREVPMRGILKKDRVPSSASVTSVE